jgi:uncharacterized protein (TIGR02217 family)
MSQLPFIESLNIQTTIKFEQNKILINAAGQEQRIVPHQSPLREFNLSKKSLTPAEVTAIYALFQSCEGRKNTFLYQDKSDYEATRIAKNLAAGVTTQGVVINSNGQYLLCKKYTCGANVHYRPIYSATNLTIYTSGGSVATGWIFNLGGTITGLTGSGHTATFDFDVLVRFNSDQLDSVIETKKVNPVYSLNVTLIEQRFNLPFWFVDTFNDDCAHQFAIDFLFKSTTTQAFNNQLKDLASGFNKIVQYQDDPITEITFGERTALSQIDFEYMQAFWLCVKGSGAFWDFEGADEVSVKAAFRDNNLAYTLTAPQPKQYSVSPLTARLFYEGISVDTGNNGWTGSVLTLCDCVEISVPLCTPQTIEFSDNFASGFNWTFRSTQYVGNNNSGNASAVTQLVSGYVSTTLNYGGVAAVPSPGLSGGILTSWDSPFAYTTPSGDELITVTWKIDAIRIDSVPGPAPYELYCVQNGNQIILAELDPTSSWTTLTSVFSLDSLVTFIPGSSLIFGVRRRNATAYNDTSSYTTQTGMDNFYLKIEVECPG